MAEPHAHDEFTSLFSSPAAWCDASGAVVSCNDAFAAWAQAPVIGARVAIHGARGVLIGHGERARPLVMVALADGGWLAIAEAAESNGAVAAVAAAVATRLERVESALESNARIGLLEGPKESVGRCLREVLATTEELRLLRRQVAAFGVVGAGQDVPVCLRALLRDARAALRHLPIAVDAPEGDYTVELDRGRFFPVLVGLLEALASTASPAGPLRVTLRSGDFVRLHLAGPPLPPPEAEALAAARRFLAASGGRVLVEPGAAVTLELPAFAGRLAAAPSRGHIGTVLIVDDDESALAMMGAVLNKVGFRVLAASDGVAASALLRQHLSEIVAIVADAVLPGRSGVELVEEARRSIPGLPVLLVSGHSSDLLGGADLGQLPILTKPFGARALAERVRALLELGQQRV